MDPLRGSKSEIKENRRRKVAESSGAKVLIWRVFRYSCLSVPAGAPTL
jgi:hypothetical protein